MALRHFLVFGHFDHEDMLPELRTLLTFASISRGELKLRKPKEVELANRLLNWQEKYSRKSNKPQRVLRLSSSQSSTRAILRAASQKRNYFSKIIQGAETALETVKLQIFSNSKSAAVVLLTSPENILDEAVRVDCLLIESGADPPDILDVPLFPGELLSPSVADMEKSGRSSSFLRSTATNVWSFWREWYQSFLDGEPMDWELQQRVALIVDAIWEAGPEAVAEEIERIRAEWLAEKLPQAEKVKFNSETGKFYTVPLDITKPDLLGATLSQVEDALDDVLASPSNGLHDNAREVRVLRRVFRKYGNDPQQIEMGFVSVHKGLTRQLLNEELPASEENLALQDALEEGARGIRATHPDVAENRKILADQAIRELPEDAREKLEKALPVLVSISEPDLAEDWQHDIPQLINDATLPMPTGAPPLPGADETTRVFSRVAKISLLIRSTKAIKSHPLYESGEVLLTLTSLIGLGATIFALLI